MRYSVPVNAAEEVPALVEAGASELYCGYLDAWWRERYADHDSASRRQGRANLATPDELERTVRAAASAGVPIHLALNVRYTEPQLDHLEGLCTAFAEMGGTGVIASDLGLLWRLRGHDGLERTLSLLAVAQNVPTLAAYHRLGVTRVALPRFVGPDEAGSLLRAVPGMEASFMAFFDKCPWVDGYCTHRHGVTYLSRETDGAADDAPALPTFDTTYRSHACLGRAASYLEPYPCAACHLRGFERNGVGTAKLGGRGRPLDERLRALRFLRQAHDLPDDAARGELYQRTYGRPCACYYGPSRQGREAIEPLGAPPSDARRELLGSQTSFSELREALARLACTDGRDCGAEVTLLVPPLSQAGLEALVAALPTLSERLRPGAHVCVNDLGTLVTLVREVAERGLPLQVTMGTLLARVDSPDEVAHFLAPHENPSRPVWGPDGEPRTLVYAPPPAALVRHWQRPSATEPSAQEALAWLVGTGIPYEFGTVADAGVAPREPL